MSGVRPFVFEVVDLLYETTVTIHKIPRSNTKFLDAWWVEAHNVCDTMNVHQLSRLFGLLKAIRTWQDRHILLSKCDTEVKQ